VRFRLGLDTTGKGPPAVDVVVMDGSSPKQLEQHAARSTPQAPARAPGEELSGKVHQVNAEKGFGFIQTHDGKSYFCPKSELRNAPVGAAVRFRLGLDTTGKGPPAVDVVVMDGSSPKQLEQHAARSTPQAPARAPGEELSGKVHQVKAEKGFGFIQTDDGKSYYCHFRDTKAGTLTDGARMRFQLAAADDQGRRKAIKVYDPALTAFSTQQQSGGEEVCLLHEAGRCSVRGARCERGVHLEAPPDIQPVVERLEGADFRLVQEQWEKAPWSFRGQAAMYPVIAVWQVRTRKLQRLVAATQSNFLVQSKPADVLDAWHGTRNENVMGIITHGFDALRRCGQAYGAGEYFAKSPSVSMSYCRGGGFMFLCRLVLGEPDVDHTWVSGQGYYVLKNLHGNTQAMPNYVLQFGQGEPHEQVARELQALVPEQQYANLMELQKREKGGTRPEPRGSEREFPLGRETRKLWVGWLHPDLVRAPDEEVEQDVRQFLHDLPVVKVSRERNSGRVGAHVTLGEKVGAAVVTRLRKRRYRGEFLITVDNEEMTNEDRDKPCPRLNGPGKFCRGWNLAKFCVFRHDAEDWPTHGARYTLEAKRLDDAKGEDLGRVFLRSAPFPSDSGRRTPKIVEIEAIRNPTLEKLYYERTAYLRQKHGAVNEQELWHGTSPAALSDLLTSGLQPPSDRDAGPECPKSGGKGLSTTLCHNKCPHCINPHQWSRCHMYGLGIYLADMAQKSHRYVKPEIKDGKEVYTLIRCTVCLGKPYHIKGNLKTGDDMHRVVQCVDPTRYLDHAAEEFKAAAGHDSYFVEGQKSKVTVGKAVWNSEYIVYNPWQVLPTYLVRYVLE